MGEITGLAGVMVAFRLFFFLVKLGVTGRRDNFRLLLDLLSSVLKSEGLALGLGVPLSGRPWIF